jgi:ribose 5-phosphate isomerase B
MYQGYLAIASDHAGYQLKKRLVRFVENELNGKIQDFGPSSYDENDDYPDYAVPLAQAVAKENGRGILICGSGIGVCMTANKIPGIRAGIGYNIGAAESMMTDDNTNIICLPAKLLSEDHATVVVKKWLESQFSGAERHVRRLKKVADLEK